MTDPAATLRALADACDRCDEIARAGNIKGAMSCFVDQRQALADCLPGLSWRDSAPALRTMADTIDRLTRERDEARALLAAAVPGLERDALRSGNGDVLTRVRAWLGVSDG